MRYVRSTELTHLTTGSLCPLSNISHFPYSPATGNHHSTLFLWVRLFRIPHVSEIKSISFSGLFHRAWCPQGPSYSLQMAGFPSFSWLNNLPSRGYATSLSVHLLTDTDCVFYLHCLTLRRSSTFLCVYGSFGRLLRNACLNLLPIFLFSCLLKIDF